MFFVLPICRISQFVRQPVDGHHSNFTTSTRFRYVHGRMTEFRLPNSLEKILTSIKSFLSLMHSLSRLGTKQFAWTASRRSGWKLCGASHVCQQQQMPVVRCQQVDFLKLFDSCISPLCRRLHLDHNQFNGTIPSSYMTVGNGRLESLSLNHNQLTGWVPDDFTIWNKMSKYTFLQFAVFVQLFARAYKYFHGSFPSLPSISLLRTAQQRVWRSWQGYLQIERLWQWRNGGVHCGLRHLYMRGLLRSLLRRQGKIKIKRRNQSDLEP